MRRAIFEENGSLSTSFSRSHELTVKTHYPKSSVCGQRNLHCHGNAVSTVCEGQRRWVFGKVKATGSRAASTSVIASRIENRRSDCSLPVNIRRGFRRAAAIRFGLALFPVPSHRTGCWNRWNQNGTSVVGYVTNVFEIPAGGSYPHKPRGEPRV